MGFVSHTFRVQSALQKLDMAAYGLNRVVDKNQDGNNEVEQSLYKNRVVSEEFDFDSNGATDYLREYSESGELESELYFENNPDGTNSIKKPSFFDRLKSTVCANILSKQATDEGEYVAPDIPSDFKNYISEDDYTELKKNQIELCAKLENPNGDKRDILSHSVYIEQLATHTFEEARAIARYDESTQLNVGSDVYDEESINSLEEAVNQFRNESTEEESVDEFTNEEVKNIFRSFDEEAMKSTENTFGSFD